MENALILFVTLLMKLMDLYIGLHFTSYPLFLTHLGLCFVFYFQQSIDQAYLSQLFVSMHISQAKTVNSDIQKVYVFSVEGQEDDFAFTEAECSFATFHPCKRIQESVPVPILQVKMKNRSPSLQGLQTPCSFSQ